MTEQRSNLTVVLNAGKYTKLYVYAVLWSIFAVGGLALLHVYRNLTDSDRVRQAIGVLEAVILFSIAAFAVAATSHHIFGWPVIH